MNKFLSAMSVKYDPDCVMRADEQAERLELKGQAYRLFVLMYCADESNTTELRALGAIGNISQAAILLNQRLANEGDPRRVRCIRTSMVKNRYGSATNLGIWKMVAPTASSATTQVHQNAFT